MAGWWDMMERGNICVGSGFRVPSSKVVAQSPELPAQRVRRLLASVLCLLTMSGCAPWWRADQEFFGRYFTAAGKTSTDHGNALDLSGQGGDAITVQGATHPSVDQQRVTLRLENHGGATVPMSYVIDEYIAKTFSGRTLTLEKDDFFTYPDALRPGDEHQVTVLLPKDLPALEVAELIVKMNNGKTVILLKPIRPRASVTTSLDGKSWQPITEPPPSELWAPPLEPAAHVPVVPEPTGAAAPTTEPPAGTVPVVVEFQQELGSSMKVNVHWDEAGVVTTLTNGEHRMFYVVPGQHVLHVDSRLHSLDPQETLGRIPVSVSAVSPLRLHVDGRARLDGVELRVRIWQGTVLLLDQALVPASLTMRTP